MCADRIEDAAAQSLPLLKVSVVVPCRNEVENVAGVVARLPAFGRHVELIFVDDGSTDGTSARVKKLISSHPERDVKLVRRSGGEGKAAAVFHGFDNASGDIVMILDADMTVAPEDLPAFYRPLAAGEAEFVNGTRFRERMEHNAMPLANKLGNRVYSAVMSWITGTPLSDTLCGTKAFFRSDWSRFAEVLPMFGGHDRWGDFDLLLAAAYYGLQVVEVPVHYGARQEGESKMQPFRHGMALGRTCLAGALHVRYGRKAPRKAPGSL